MTAENVEVKIDGETKSNNNCECFDQANHSIFKTTTSDDSECQDDCCDTPGADSWKWGGNVHGSCAGYNFIEKAGSVASFLSTQDFYSVLNMESIRAKYGPIKENIKTIAKETEKTPIGTVFNKIVAANHMLEVLNNAKSCSAVYLACGADAPECSGKGPTHCSNNGAIVEYYCDNGNAGNLPDWCTCEVC